MHSSTRSRAAGGGRAGWISGVGRIGLVGLFMTATALPGCSPEDTERRARVAAESMKESLPDIDGAARAQRVSPEVVRQVQQELAKLHEYQGEITGEIDPVTINAIQAFQRAQRLHDDGVLDPRTLERLTAAAAQAGR